MKLFRGRLGFQPSLLFILSVVIMMGGQGLAQNNNPANTNTATNTVPANTNQNTATNTNTATTAPTTAAATTTTNTAPATTTAQTSVQTTQTQANTNTDTGLPALTTSTSSTSSTSSASTTSAPTTSRSSGTDTGLPSLPSLPPLTDGSGNNLPIPVATVPPTANAPYMQKSTLPEGTIFIAVGAALGAIGLSVLAWRGLVAWSINRSVRRAAIEQAQSENKALLRQKRKPRRRSSHHRSRRDPPGTSMSMEKLPPRDRQSHVSTRTPPSQSSLFFSPTAGPGAHQAGNRGSSYSSYLPAGYYSAGNAAPGAHSRSNLGPSPPGSPSLPPSRGHDAPFNRSSHLGASTSTLNLNVPPQGRAPSAYLEDLFESHTPASPGDHHR